MVGIILIGAFIAICINWAISAEFQNIAAEKGYAEHKYFLYCFFFGVIGYLMVIALPDQGMRYVARTTHAPAPSPVASPVRQPAPAPTATPNAPTPNPRSNDFWVCPTCHTKNLNSRDTCWSCNAPKN